MGTESETDVGGQSVLFETGQHSAIAPCTAAIERSKEANFKAIVSWIGKELGTTDEVQWIARVLDKHRLAVSTIGIVAHLDICIGQP